ncbi:hypothetical protein GYMLUDRAFT_182276 [Collybiopsis luxurians FD-317 M1]|uniref:Nephrocystin 3-like N-terminal domain-containing protein n=1 Tax=Collybiopsis luxurians FD-317 M1 TaxID=944289 RepID=A0A0D0BMR5_9AGAR|nr:hypothetical protein GYMLUDRAFT_182276 [Collybiopsis luxurians FD-317 M1]
MLYQTAVPGAAHNAEQRSPPPNCFPGTRIQILEILRNWVNDSTNTAPIYWLYGAAGVGKSAVAQTISEEFVNNRLAASFFFSRADPKRNHLQLFSPPFLFNLRRLTPLDHFSEIPLILLFVTTLILSMPLLSNNSRNS